MLVVPLGIEAPPGAPEALPRATPATWSAIAALATLFLLERLALAAVAHGWPLPAGPVAGALWWSASAKLYPDPALFAPWQLWSHALVQAGWWQAVAVLVAIGLAGRAIERWIGSGATALLLAVLAPLAAAVHLLRPGAAPVVGGAGVAAGLLGAAWALFPTHRVRGALLYYLVVVVGAVRFHLGLRLVVLLFVAQELFRLRLADPHAAALDLGADVLLAGLVAGLLLGLALRRFLAWSQHGSGTGS